MKTLDELFQEFGSDKSSAHANPHGYAAHYEAAFAPLKDKCISLLEIGVGSGASIRAWLDYFPKAAVYGVDTTKDTNDWNTVEAAPNDRYVFVPGDQASQEFWSEFLVEHGHEWDIIIDDGGHYANQVITSYNCLWPAVKPGGFYCIEDLNVSYPDLWGKYGDSFVKDPWTNHMDFIKGKLDLINRRQEDIERMLYSNELAILQKKV
jgi:8-demethyl-8-alpha-L-rhamnosyltetracenomycin-C 2'-O-methyltransferase